MCTCDTPDKSENLMPSPLSLDYVWLTFVNPIPPTPRPPCPKHKLCQLRYQVVNRWRVGQRQEGNRSGNSLPLSALISIKLQWYLSKYYLNYYQHHIFTDWSMRIVKCEYNFRLFCQIQMKQSAHCKCWLMSDFIGVFIL